MGIKIIKVIKLLKHERDTKEKTLKEQRVILEYLEKAFELEKQASLSDMAAELKDKMSR